MVKGRDSKGRFLKGTNYVHEKIKIDLNFIISEYKNGKSTKDIADTLGLNQKTIYNRLKENGIETRKRGEHSNHTKQKISKTLKEKGIRPKIIHKGKTPGSFKKGQKPWNMGKMGLQISEKKGKCYEELYNKDKVKEIKTKIKASRAKQIFPVKDSSIEVKMQNLLKQLGIEFRTHVYIKEIEHAYQCDIMIPVQKGITRKTIIECFGDYWHKRPTGRPIDASRANELREKGWRVLTFWGSEIRPMQLNDLGIKLC